MSGIAKVLLATVLTLPLVAFVTGVLVAPEAPAPDRSRPVIIGNVDERPDEPPTDRAGPRPSERPTERPTERPGREDDADDRTRGPVSVVTPAPQELDDDDDGVGDDDGDGDDRTDDDGGDDGADDD